MFEVPSVEDIADEHGATGMIDVATFGLSPGVAISVEPSGITEPFVAGFASPAAEPLDADVAEVPAGLVASQTVDTVEPPPSKGAIEFVVGHGTTSGLIPPRLSSVAPRGIWVGSEGDTSDGMVPSGDVMPMPDVGPDCA